MFLILAIELLGKNPCIGDYISSLIFKIAVLMDLILITYLFKFFDFTDSYGAIGVF